MHEDSYHKITFAVVAIMGAAFLAGLLYVSRIFG